MNKKTQVKTDAKCENFKFRHCLHTQSLSHGALVQPCDIDADYCVKKRKTE